MLQTITNRRSIRKYTTQMIPQEIIEQIINAGRLAPSSKNRQPWKFIVVSGNSKMDMLNVMKQGLEREKRTPFLPNSSNYLNGAKSTWKIMHQAPVVIFIINPLGLDINQVLTPEERIFELCNSQSIGAAIENMILTATKLGLGSLWICDIYFAYQELSEWLNTKGELFAAVTIGYADEAPCARPRKEMKDIVTWRM